MEKARNFHFNNFFFKDSSIYTFEPAYRICVWQIKYFQGSTDSKTYYIIISLLVYYVKRVEESIDYASGFGVVV